MNEREESLAGERLPLWVALALAAFGVIGAVAASQLIAESTTDDGTAAPAVAPSESNASGSSDGREDDPSGESLSEAADQGGTDGVAGRAGADDTADAEQGADDTADAERGTDGVAGRVDTADAEQGADETADAEQGADETADDADAADDAGTDSSVTPPADCPPVFVLRFATGSAEPNDVDPTRVADLVAWLAEHPESEMLLDGHADAAGSEEGNLQLSFRRAEAAAALLVDGGASPDLMQPRGFGEYQPLPGEAPDSGRNRRVTMQVSGLESCPSNDNPTDEE